MRKYVCDVVSQKYRIRCPNAAVLALVKDAGYGKEMYHFCAMHVPNDWGMFSAVYAIKDDELLETGISKRNRQPECEPEGPTVTMPAEPSPEPVAKELAREALKHYREKATDLLFMRELKIRWP